MKPKVFLRRKEGWLNEYNRHDNRYQVGRASRRRSIPYIELGDSGGVPVLFLHGLTDSWLSFEGVLPHLPGSMHAFALSQRGHGDATRPATG